MAWQKTMGLGLCALLLFTAHPAQAQWRWRDASGQTHVSDLPPPRDTPEKNILQRPEASAKRPAPATANASAPASDPALVTPAAQRVDPTLEARRKKTEQEQADRAKAEEQRNAAQRSENCQRARNHLAGLDSGVRLAHTNAKGEREILDDKARADESRRARDIIASDCR